MVRNLKQRNVLFCNPARVCTKKSGPGDWMAWIMATKIDRIGRSKNTTGIATARSSVRFSRRW